MRSLCCQRSDCSQAHCQRSDWFCIW